MKYSLIDNAPETISTPCLVTSLKGARAVARSQGSGAILSRSTQDFKDKPEQSLLVQLGGKSNRLLILGGADDQLTFATYKKIAAHAASQLAKLPVKQAVIALDQKTTIRKVYCGSSWTSSWNRVKITWRHLKQSQ